MNRADSLTLGAMVLFTVLAVAVFQVLPLLLGALIDDFGLTAQQAGLIASADMGGAMLSAFGVSWLMSRYGWKRLMACGIVTLTLMDGLSAVSHGLQALVTARFVAGLGEGVLLAIALAGIGEARNADRVFGLATTAQLAFGTAELFAFPALRAWWGLVGIFVILALVTGLSLPLLKWTPNGARAVAAPAPVEQQRGALPESLLSLTGLFVYFAAQGGVWAYLDRIGAMNHISGSQVATALAVSSAAGILGASCASWLGSRFGRLRPLGWAVVASVLSLLILNAPIAQAPYLAAVSLFNFAWNFSVPYQFALLSDVDPSRRTVALGGGVGFAGLAAGPVIAATLVDTGHFHNVNWLGVGLCAISFLLFSRVLRTHPTLAPDLGTP